MIRATLSDGRFLFGIDAENVRRLKAGSPIQVDLSTMGGQGVFILVYGDTLADIVRDLEEGTGQKLPVAMPYVTPGKKPQ
jgi:hypothetical protein